MKLYQFSISPNAKRTRVIANELGIKLDIEELDFRKGQHKTPDYMKLNPNGKVPTLVDDDGTTVWESPATLVYLAAKQPEKGLLPGDPRGRAEAMRWMFWNASHLERHCFEVGFERMLKPMMGGQPDQARVDAASKEWERFGAVLNGHLEGKQWILGNQFSIADICLGTTVEFATLCGLEPPTHVKAWLGRLQARDAWKQA